MPFLLKVDMLSLSDKTTVIKIQKTDMETKNMNFGYLPQGKEIICNYIMCKAAFSWV